MPDNIIPLVINEIVLLEPDNIEELSEFLIVLLEPEIILDSFELN